MRDWLHCPKLSYNNWLRMHDFTDDIWCHDFGVLVNHSTFPRCGFDWNGDWIGATMDELKIDYRSARSSKARISVKLNRTRITILSIVAVDIFRN
jgi:hypothetical protein